MNKVITPRLEHSQARGPEILEEGTGLSVVPWDAPWGKACSSPSPAAGRKEWTFLEEAYQYSVPGLSHDPEMWLLSERPHQGGGKRLVEVKYHG